jgi:hypothetical protein
VSVTPSTSTALNQPLPPPTGSPLPAAAANRIRPTRSTTASAGSAANATRAGSPSGRKGKFNAGGEHVESDSHGKVWCASSAEAERFRQLLALFVDGKIENLKTQPVYPLVVESRHIAVYRADFCYDVIDERGRLVRHVIEDVKGMITPEFRIKHKLFDALYPTPLSVIEVKGKARHSTRPTLSEKTGNPIGCVPGWMDLHWKGRIPN